MTTLRLLVFICFAFPGHLFAQLSFDLFYGPSKSSKHPEQIISDGKGHFYMVVQQYSSNNTYAQLLYSGDGGIHWTDRTTEKGWHYFVGRNGMLYGVQNQSLYRSADLGATWALVTATMPGTLNSQLSASADGVLNLTSNEGIYQSTDDGLTWEKTLDHDIKAHHLYNWPDLGGLWITHKNGKIFELWHSADQGAHWSVAYTTTHDFPFNENALMPGPDDLAIYLNLGGDYNRVARSIDGGASWQESVVKLYAPARVMTMAALPSGEVVVQMNDKQWYHSTDQGLNWSVFSPGWPSGLSIVQRLYDGPLFASGTLGLHKWDDTANDWTFAGDELDFFHSYTWTGPDQFIGILSGSAYLKITSGIHEYGRFDIPGFYPSQIISDKNGNMYYRDHSRLYRMPGPDTLFTSSFQDNGTLNDFAVAPDGAIYLLTDNFLYHSPDGGASWTASAPVPVYHIFGHLAVSPAGPVYVTDYNHLWRSVDGGATLEMVGDKCCFEYLTAGADGAAYFSRNDYFCTFGRVSATDSQWQEFGICPVPVQNAYSVRHIVPAGPDEFWAGGEWDSMPAVFHSVDNGLTWEHHIVDNKLIAKAFVALAPDGHLYATTSETSALYRTAFYRSTVPVWDPSVSTTEKELSPIRLYPNPAGDYVLAEIPGDSQGWSFMVYDMLGRCLSAKDTPPGQTTIRLPLTMPAGPYWVIARSDDGRYRHAGRFVKQ